MSSVRTLTLTTPLLKLGLNLGEGPIYESSTDTVHFLDINGCKVLHYAVEAGKLEVDEVDEPVGCLVLRAGGGLACCARQGFATLTPTPGREKHLTINYISKPLSPALAPYTRFNDGACDPLGRFFCGTLLGRGAGEGGTDLGGELWCLGIGDEGTRLVEGGWTDSNGMAWWEEDGKWTYYFTDSGRNKIHAYSYDLATGQLSNKRTHIDGVALGLTAHPYEQSTHDGLCVDSEGCIWSARWKGSRVVRYSKDGSAISMIIEIPGAYNITMPIFCGKNLDKMFITTASNKPINGDAEQLLDKYPHQGDVFLHDFKDEFTAGVYRWEFKG